MHNRPMDAHQYPPKPAPEIRYSADGWSVAVRWFGDDYWYRFDHPTVNSREHGTTFRCMPGTFDDAGEWINPFERDESFGQ